jgi:hypothetical protein
MRTLKEDGNQIEPMRKADTRQSKTKIGITSIRKTESGHSTSKRQMQMKKERAWPGFLWTRMKTGHVKQREQELRAESRTQRTKSFGTTTQEQDPDLPKDKQKNEQHIKDAKNQFFT